MSHGEPKPWLTGSDSEERILNGRYGLKEALFSEKGKSIFAGFHQYTQRDVRVFRYDMGIYDRDILKMRAKALGDFSRFSTLCSVIDTMETADFFYIILEEPKGESLGIYCKQKEKMPQEQLVEKLLILLSCFQKLETAGIEDLFLQEVFVGKNGDFSILPAFESRQKGSGDYCYDICEIFYICRSRQMPPKRILRLLFDEMQPLAKVDPKGDALLHQIMEKGLEIDPEQTYQSVRELQEALRDWLEKQKPKQEEKWRRITKTVMITFGCLLLLIGICRIYWEELYFFGIETETILLVPDGHMTLTDYENAVSDIKQQISSFAKKQYITEKDGKIRIVLPWKTYQEKKSELETFQESFQWIEEQKAEWMVRSYLKSKNWVMAEKIREPSVTLEYTLHTWLDEEENEWNRTKGVYYHTLIDLSTRLEKLEIPYAVGISREDKNKILIRVEQKEMSTFLFEVLTSNLKICIEDVWGESLQEVSGLSVQKNGSGYELCVQSEKEKISETILKTQTLYLSLYTNTGKYDLAERPASDPKKGEESTEDTNVLFFSICRTGEGERLTEEQKPLIAMLDLALKTGTLKHTFDLTGVQYGIGNKLSDVSSQRKEAYVLRKDDAAWMQDKLAEILPDAQVQELDAGQISPRAEIVLHMELEGNYAEKTAGRIDQILRACNLSENRYDNLHIWLGERGTYPSLELQKNAGEKCWELYYYGNESKEEQNLKKQLQEIADQNKLVWKTE